MEAKHTPGPWLVMNTSDVFTGLAAKAADGRSTAKDDGWHIADCAPGGSYVDGGSGLHELSLDEIKANARLIAAAPELLEALRPFSALLEIFEQKSANRPKSGPIYATADHRVGGRELTVEHLKAARAAIAKAEGK